MRGESRDAGWVDAAPRDPTKPPSYVPIAAELLRRLYVDEELTVDAIAPRLGCATTTVFRRLRSFAIPVRPTGPIPRRHIHEIRWDPEVAYAVGLIATDGNLSRDGRHMSVTSKDRDLIETLRRCLRLSNSISRIQNRTGNFYHKVQWCDRGLYDWLLSIGLTPAKSLTLGPLAVPDEYLVGVAVREAEIDQSAPLDLLRPDRSLSRPEARYCGTFPPPSGTRFRAPRG